MMKCTVCNHENRPGVNFCESCGNQLSQTQAAGTNQRFCPNCGQSNIPTEKFCSSCGYDFISAQLVNIQSNPPSIKSSLKKASRLTLAGLFITLLILYVWGVLDTLSPLSGNQTAEAEKLAIEFVQENYPQLENAKRTAYTANIQGTDYYVVDFVLDDLSQPPMGVRILVDRLLRAVFAYEAIEG